MNMSFPSILSLKKHSYSSSTQSLALSSDASSTQSVDEIPEQAVGTLIVVVLEAKNLFNRRTIAKQDPYCTLRINKQHSRTRAVRRGGQTPKWDYECRFYLTEEDLKSKLKLGVFDATGKTAEIIGDTDISIRPALKAKVAGYDSWHPITYKNEFRGEVFLEMTYYPHKRHRKERHSLRSESSLSSHSTAFSPFSSAPNLSSVPTSRPLPKPPVSEHAVSRQSSTSAISAYVPFRTSRFAQSAGDISIAASEASDSYMTSVESLDLPDIDALDLDLDARNIELPEVPEMDTSAQDVISREINIGYEESLFKRLNPR